MLRNEKIRNLLTHPMIAKLFIWFNIFMVTLMAGFTLYAGLLKPADDPLQQYRKQSGHGHHLDGLVSDPAALGLPGGTDLVRICPIAGIGDLAARVKKFNLPVPGF